MATLSLIDRLSRAVDLLEQRSQLGSLKVVKVRRGFDEDAYAAQDRHFATHPEDRDASIIIYKFFDSNEMVGI
jgi:hypothetical protein